MDLGPELERVQPTAVTKIIIHVLIGSSASAIWRLLRSNSGCTSPQIKADSLCVTLASYRGASLGV